MPFEVTQLGDEPIIIVTIIPPPDMVDEPKQILAATSAIVRRLEGTVFRITDITRFEPSFELVVMAMAQDIRHSEKNIRHVFVGKGDMVALAAEAIKQPHYGAREGHIVASMEEAIAYAREHLKD